MKAAFPTDDRINISKHTGRAKEFAVYEISEGEILNTEYIRNDHLHHDHHEENEQGHSHKELVDQFKGVDFLFVNHVGKHFKQNLEEADVNYLITDEEDIMKILGDLMSK